MSGKHSVEHIASLVSQLPLNARINVKKVDDARWTQSEVLLASIFNQLAALCWGMSDPKKRGAAPKPIGPSYMSKPDEKKLDTRVLTIDQLTKELQKPRRAVK